MYSRPFLTSPPQFTIVLEKTHLVNLDDAEATPAKEDIVPHLFFNLQDIISIELQDVDINYAVSDSFTDSGISSRQNGSSVEKV